MNPTILENDEYLSDEQQRIDTEMIKMLQIMFVQKNQNKYNEIVEAINSGDMNLAHRLSHTLKGNAGQIGKTKLQEIAERVEVRLRDGNVVLIEDIKEDMNQLEAELTLILEELKPLYEKSIRNITPLSTEETLALFDRLQGLLERLNPGCLDLVDELRTVPGAEKLVEEIEEFNLRAALPLLLELRQNLQSQSS